MLPFNTQNVAYVFRAAGSTRLTSELHIPHDKRNNPLAAAEWWVTNSEDKRWRKIILELDWVGKTAIADELMPYSEPPSGV